MRKTTIILLGLLFPLFLFSQKKENKVIIHGIEILKIHEASLAQLSPFEDDELEAIIHLDKKVTEKLLEMLHQNDILEVAKDSLPFFDCQSANKDFAIFSWEEKMGGTAHPFTNVFYWKNPKGIPRATSTDEEVLFTKIYELENKEGEKLFLLLGSMIACQTCVREEVLLMKVKENELETVFSQQMDYSFNMDIAGFSFDEKTQILSYQFLEEGCKEEEEEKCWVHGTFSFDGNTFVLKW